MRRLVPGFALACLAPAASAADTDAVVTAKEIVVYAAPGDTAPDTGTLPHGTKVLVHHEEPGGWLAVQPPNGSISWVNHRFLDFGDAGLTKLPATATVRGGEAGIEIEAGSFTKAAPLGVRRTKLAPDTVVTVMGPRTAWAADGSFWYPIWSPHDDYRYVKRDGVQVAMTDRMVTQTAGHLPPPAAPIVERLPLGSSDDSTNTFKPSRPADWPTHPLWREAEAADKSGDWDRAERLYFQLAGEMNKPGGDAELANLSYSRIHSIRERRRAGKGGEKVAVKSTAPVVDPAVQPASARTVSSSSQPKDVKDAWYGPGTLYVAVSKYQNQAVYALESEPGRVVAYCLPAAGFDPQPYVRRRVMLAAKVLDANYLSGGPLVMVSSAELAK
jgi:hypothetical protein